jgi:hypothetical protein
VISQAHAHLNTSIRKVGGGGGKEEDTVSPFYRN